MTGLPNLRRFYLRRSVDKSGVSGIGIVAEGVQFSSGKVVLSWLRPPHAIGIYGSLAEMEAVHGHGGRTRLCWLDEALELENVCSVNFILETLRSNWTFDSGP